MKNLMNTGMLLLALTFGQHAYSQETKHDNEDVAQRVDMRLDKLEKELNLNAEQKAQLREIHLQSSLKRKELREQMRVLESERKQQIKAVLTPEQFEKMKAIQQQRIKEKQNKTCTCGKKK